jgi:hypothetical protein
MKISQNFDVREFVPKHIWDIFKEKSVWFVNPNIVSIAEFYKSFFTTYYKKKLGNDVVRTVAISVNNWHIGGAQQWRGLRTSQCTQGAVNSQHRYMNAFDTEIFIVYADGKRVEVDYKEIHKVIQDNEAEFMANGVTTIEDLKIASGWLHTDCRWIPDQKKILIVGL